MWANWKAPGLINDMMNHWIAKNKDRLAQAQRLGIIRVSRALYEAYMADHPEVWPDTSRIVTVSEQHFFATGDVAYLIQDPAFNLVDEGVAVPEYTAICTTTDNGWGRVTGYR